MQTQLPTIITKHFHVTESGKEYHLRCKGCEKEYKVAKPAQGKAINNLMLRAIEKHTTTHTYPEEDLGEDMEEQILQSRFNGDRDLMRAAERGADTSYDEKGEPVALPLAMKEGKAVPFPTKEPKSDPNLHYVPEYPYTYQVVDVSGKVTVNKIPNVHVYREPECQKVGEVGYMVTLHAANPRHAEAVAKGIIAKAREVPKKRLTWRDKRHQKGL